MAADIREVAVVVLILAVISAGVPVQAQEQLAANPAKKGKVEVTIIETDLGAEQPLRRGTLLAQRAPVATIKPDIQWDRPASAKTSPEREDVIDGALNSAQVMQVNRSLKNLVEENERLQAKVDELDQALKSLRGQYKLDMTRLDAVTMERDAYKQQSERIVEMQQQYEKDLAALKQTQQERENLLAERVGELQAQLEQAIAAEKQAAVQPETVATAPEQAQAVLAETKAPEASLVPAVVVKAPAAVQPVVTEEPETVPVQDPRPDPLAARRAERERRIEEARLRREERLQEVEAAKEARRAAEEAVVEKTAEPMTMPAAKTQAKVPVSDAKPAAVSPVVQAGHQVVLADQNKSFDVMSMIDNISRQSRKMTEDEAKIHYNMGNIFFKQGSHRRAYEEYQKAVELMPQDANTHFNVAFLAGEYLHEYEKAVEHYEKYLFLNPGAPDAARVKEKILEAKLFLNSRINSNLENDLTKNWQDTMHR